jgi:hypothetical protein
VFEGGRKEGTEVMFPFSIQAEVGWYNVAGASYPYLDSATTQWGVWGLRRLKGENHEGEEYQWYQRQYVQVR